jgi:hypothetical protein
MPGTSNPNRYSCQIPPSGSITQCEDFTNEDNCEDNTNPSIPRASYGGSPPSCTFLECFWDEDDRKKETSEWDNGVYHGLCVIWHPNGCKSSSGQYFEGKEIGKWIYWHPNGKISKAGFFGQGGKPIKVSV